MTLLRPVLTFFLTLLADRWSSYGTAVPYQRALADGPGTVRVDVPTAGMHLRTVRRPGLSFLVSRRPFCLPEWVPPGQPEWVAKRPLFGYFSLPGGAHGLRCTRSQKGDFVHNGVTFACHSGLIHDFQVNLGVVQVPLRSMA